jgi:Ca-activated chloride channel homolog
VKRVLLLAILIACDRGERRDARVKYNEGVDALTASKFDDAEKALLAARSTAGVDPELRFRAAYDLGMAYAAHADQMKTGKDADLNKALELEQQAVTWFSDASHQRTDDADTQANLAIVRARAQALTDELARGEGKLEVRLDAVIKEQRGVLDQARDAWIAIKQAGGSDPLAQQDTLTKLADQERGIVAEAGVISDLAADEIDTIGKQPADKRKPEDASRLVQLKNLDIFMLESRTKIAEARRKLQDLAAEDGVARAETALGSLKRAKEQLLDPIVVLRGIGADEMQLVQETHAVAEVKDKAMDLSGSAAAPKQLIPAWLEPPALGERQTDMHDRLEEIRTRLAAALDSVDKPVGTGSAAEPPKLTAEQAKMFDQLKLAMPFVTEAGADMVRAHDALGAQKLDDATIAERDAVIALAKAVELFSDLKATVDLAYATEQQLVSLLAPEAAKQPDRAQNSRDALAQNIGRMPRIKELIADEQAKLDAEIAKGPPPPEQGKPAPDPKQIEAQKQQLQQAKQQMNAAEVLRADAEKAIAAIDAAIKTNKDPLTPAKDAEAKLLELRKLFFNVVEHLQQLLKDQNETKDQTSQANTEDDFTRAPKLPKLATDEGQHGQLAKEISDALAKQADAGAKGQGEQQDQAKKFAAAAEEVRLATTDMGDAKVGLDKAATAKQSVSLEPPVKSEAKAVEHLENALKILQPPQKNDQQKQDDKKQDQQKQDQQKKQDQQQQQGGAGQRARDEDAKRQREKQQQGQDAPVDKDW